MLIVLCSEYSDGGRSFHWPLLTAFLFLSHGKASSSLLWDDQPPYVPLLGPRKDRGKRPDWQREMAANNSESIILLTELVLIQYLMPLATGRFGIKRYRLFCLALEFTMKITCWGDHINAGFGSTKAPFPWLPDLCVLQSSVFSEEDWGEEPRAALSRWFDLAKLSPSLWMSLNILDAEPFYFSGHSLAFYLLFIYFYKWKVTLLLKKKMYTRKSRFFFLLHYFL